MNLESQALKPFVLFKELSAPQLGQVARIAHERRIPKRRTIFLEGDQGNYVVLIVSGIVKISRSSTDGRVKTLALLRANDFFGEMALFLPAHQRSATAEALTECHLITLDQADFENLLKKYPGISMRIIQTLAQRLLAANQQIKTLALGDSHSRLADLLLWLKDSSTQSSNGHPLIPLTHQELADLAGLSRETTTRMLNTFEHAGAVKLKSRQVALTDLDLLKSYAT